LNCIDVVRAFATTCAAPSTPGPPKSSTTAVGGWPAALHTSDAPHARRTV
jgi:hypothetical protein